MPSDADEQRRARPRHLGRDVQAKLVEQPIAQARADQRATALDEDVAVAGGRPGPVDGGGRPVEHEGKAVGIGQSV